ncbi:MAG: sigma-54-dependent Fis family transcriptional regulator [Saprospiraceae bacterium]|nr:sigma-54-dependent Fis family transcriptional regulator [Candidatus Vicinibacter affinis]
MARILIVDDEQSIRRVLRDILELEKYQVEEAVDGLDCLVKLKQSEYDAIILDIKMPKMDGMEALDKIQQLAADTPIVMISGHATIDTAVEAVKRGAYDFISKPPDLNRLLITLRNAIDKSSLISEKKILQKKVSKFKTQEIVGESRSIMKVRDTIELVAPTDARVLITGQNGTGKELVARWIHEKSNRSKGNIVEVNCAAIPSELIESELFGHEKGSFTSAIKQRLGKFELANGGTLFLDEIGDMSLSAQAKVLRALQESKITRVGGDKEISVDVRVIAATNKDLREEIARGKFREDLYHRLAVIIIEVPSLNERVEDIPILTEHFMEHICHEYGMPPKRIEDSAIEELQKYNWTGNIRELRNVVERLIILSKQKISRKEVLDFVIPASQRHNKFKELFEQFDTVQELNDFIRKEFTAYKSEI